jgi:hypothetical protein
MRKEADAVFEIYGIGSHTAEVGLDAGASTAIDEIVEQLISAAKSASIESACETELAE